MPLREWDDFRTILKDESLPIALIDLDAMDRNVDRIVRRAGGKTIRVATKSVRHRGLLQRILARGGANLSGLLCFAADEAVWLSERGFDDLLVAYPTAQAAPLERVANAVAGGKTIRCVVDCTDHLEALSAAARHRSTTLEAVVDLDVSYRPLAGRAHLGVRRSPLRSADDVARLVRAARSVPHVRIVGLLAYEAHVAGLPDASEQSPLARNLALRALKRAAFVPRVRDLRREAIDAMASEGVTPLLVNGGGTGSIETTSSDPSTTEIAVGSGFLCSHLFDGYRGSDLEPAQFFALEVARIPDRDHVTCAGGGYVASGTPGRDRLPLPHRPRGLRLLDLEGAGEVQTPVWVSDAERIPRIGDPIIFRHAKAGELAERFADYALIQEGRIIAREPTYRGEGRMFF